MMISNLYHYKVCCAEQQLHVVYNNITESGMLTNPAQSSLVQYSILTSQLSGQHTASSTALAPLPHNKLIKHILLLGPVYLPRLV